jgi:hypothetical protein
MMAFVDTFCLRPQEEIVDTLGDYRSNIKGHQEFPPNKRKLRECVARFAELSVTGMLRGRLRRKLRYSLGQRIA